MSYEQSGTGLGNLGGSKLTLGSLAQSARTKQIKSARLILYVVGVLNLIIALGAYALVGSLSGRPQAPAPEVLNAMKIMSIVIAAIGIVFIVLGVLTKRYPVPATITALVIYTALLAMNVLNVVNDPKQVASLFIPIVIEIALIRAVRAALAYQRELNAARTMADPLA
jgi:hypothetical protein